MRKLTIILLIALSFFATGLCQERSKLGIGYDEGLALRYFFAEKMGGQFSLGLDIDGGHDALANVHGAENTELDVGFGLGFIYSLFASQYLYLDGLAQLSFLHDDTGNDNDVGDRNWVFLRAALAPEILIASHVALGLRFGIEIATMSKTKQLVGAPAVPTETDDGEVHFAFYGPKNPLAGTTLGMSLYVYF